jgi:hypothetical protein
VRKQNNLLSASLEIGKECHKVLSRPRDLSSDNSRMCYLVFESGKVKGWCLSVLGVCICVDIWSRHQIRTIATFFHDSVSEILTVTVSWDKPRLDRSQPC